jgi:hypothetical protein
VLRLTIACIALARGEPAPSSCSDAPIVASKAGAIFMLKPQENNVGPMCLEKVEGALFDGYCFASRNEVLAYSRQVSQIAVKVQAR